MDKNVTRQHSLASFAGGLQYSKGMINDTYKKACTSYTEQIGQAVEEIACEAAVASATSDNYPLCNNICMLCAMLHLSPLIL